MRGPGDVGVLLLIRLSIALLPALHLLSHLRGRCSEATAEAVIEVGQVGKAGIERDRAYRERVKARIAQHTMDTYQPAAEHEFDERFVFGVEQHVNVPWRDAKLGGNSRGGKIVTGDIAEHVTLGGLQPRRPQAAALRDIRNFARRAKRHSGKIVHVGGQQMLEL